ncbi:MAG: PBP1A family penicillin-binding protein [Symploca sp. SIO1B1]|nr:PBP1A family penicillin-binding protein [Symploca sp. SIO1B1]
MKLHRRYWFWLGLGVSSSAVALGWGIYVVEKNVPDSTKDVLTYVRDNTITIKASDGTILQQTGPATRDTLKIWEVPEDLIDAFIAIEDRRFEKHHGVDFQGIVRAATANLLAGKVVEGGSTITQQLARIVYLNQEVSWWRKLKEMRTAQKIEQDVDKEQILERYLNLVYLGSGAYGVADAAWVYFSKTVDELTLPEIAMLAGLPPAPSVYSPLVEGKVGNEKLAKERRNLVLERMQTSGFITEAEAQKAKDTPLGIDPSPPKRLERQASYFTEYIQQELPKRVSEAVLEVKGLTVETTLNPDWQAAAEKTVKNAVSTYGSYQGFDQAALVAIDPRNGQIKAMVGGKDFNDLESNNYLNRATQAQRQPGSTFKTFVYTTAIEAGFSPNRGYLDTEYIVDGYKPKNYSETFRGWTSIIQALRNSVNIVAVKALISVGWDPTIEIAHKMGIESELKPTYSLALGASEVNLLEMTSAYGTLAARGVHTESYGIKRILDQKGNVIYEQSLTSEQVVTEDTAAIMNWMLQGVVNHGTGRAASLSRPVAGKTGTTDEARDLWFVGYIPQLVAGVWLGNDNNKPTWSTSSTAATTWRRFMVQVIEDIKVENFPKRPNNIENREANIKAKPIKPKRQIVKPYQPPAPPPQKKAVNNNNYNRGYNRNYNRGYNRNYNRNYNNNYNRNYNRSYNQGSRGRIYSQSQPARRSTYRAPARNYSAPTYSAPKKAARTYSAPVQRAAPAPAPAANPAPNFQSAPAVAPPAPPAAKKQVD